MCCDCADCVFVYENKEYQSAIKTKMTRYIKQSFIYNHYDIFKDNNITKSQLMDNFGKFITFNKFEDFKSIHNFTTNDLNYLKSKCEETNITENRLIYLYAIKIYEKYEDVFYITFKNYWLGEDEKAQEIIRINELKERYKNNPLFVY